MVVPLGFGGEDGGEGALFSGAFEKHSLVGMLSPFRWPPLREVSVPVRGRAKAEMRMRAAPCS